VRARASDEQQVALATKLDLVTDAQLKEFISGFWDSSLAYVTEFTPRRQLAQVALACDRIARVSDPKLRSELISVAGAKGSDRGRVKCPAPASVDRL
jgi:hypothetical protein